MKGGPLEMATALNSSPPSLDFMDSVFRLKDLALKAEKQIAGVMNSTARDGVLRFCAQKQGRAAEPVSDSTPSIPPSAAARALLQQLQAAAKADDSSASVGAYLQMEEDELKRMRKHEEVRKSGDVWESLSLIQDELVHCMQMAERGFVERRLALDSRAEQLTAQEQAFKHQEARLQDQVQAVRREAAALEGKDEELKVYLDQEKQRQAAELNAMMEDLQKQHEADVRQIVEQWQDAQRHRDEQIKALQAAHASLEAELQDAVGQKHAESARWQKELSDKEALIVLEHQSLEMNLAQIEQLQIAAAKASQALEVKEQALQKERKLREQIHSGGTLPPELLGQQRCGLFSVGLKQLRFSQDSVSSLFNDGRSVAETTAELRKGSLLVTDLPRLRIVEIMGRKWSLDNRRLKCMKEAFANSSDMEINVQVESLAERAVRKEFQKKFTAGQSIIERGGKASTPSFSKR